MYFKVIFQNKHPELLNRSAYNLAKLNESKNICAAVMHS